MVARKHDAEPFAEELTRSLLSTWRHALSRPAVVLSGSVSALFRDASDVAHGRLEPLRRIKMQWLGLACLISGASFRMGFSVAEGAWRGAVLTAVLTLLWAGLRLGILGMKVHDLKRDGAAVQGAWALGLVPSALAVSPWMQPVVFVLSSALTLYALEQLGEGRRSARWAVTAAWGAQAVGMLLVWLADNASIALLSRGM